MILTLMIMLSIKTMLKVRKFSIVNVISYGYICGIRKSPTHSLNTPMWGKCLCPLHIAHCYWKTLLPIVMIDDSLNYLDFNHYGKSCIPWWFYSIMYLFIWPLSITTYCPRTDLSTEIIGLQRTQVSISLYLFLKTDQFKLNPKNCESFKYM